MEHDVLAIWRSIDRFAAFCAWAAVELWLFALLTGIIALLARTMLNAWRRAARLLPKAAARRPG